MSTTKRAFAPIPLDLDDDDRIDRYAATQGIPDSRKAAPEPDRPAMPVRSTVEHSEPGAATPVAQITPAARTDLQKVTFELPAYALKALKQKALDDGVSIRHVIMRGLVKEGIGIEAVDLVEDGRRNRPRG